jgi:hypothetical protein
MQYYTLLIRIAGKWQIEFGDYEKQAVEFERDSIKDSPASGVKAKDLKIIKTDEEQSAIEAKVAELNK